MAKRTEKVGTGITERSVTLHSGPDLAPFLKQKLRRIAGDMQAQGGRFGMVTAATRESCLAALAGDQADHAPDSPEDFALRILRLLDHSTHAIAQGDADGAARWAFQAGMLASEAGMKEQWESMALQALSARQGKARQAESGAAMLAEYEAQLASAGRGNSEAIYREMADKRGVTVAAVKSALVRARKRKKA